jgi:hypothetical protein
MRMFWGVDMAFQVVELTLDADDNVLDRRVVPYPYATREEAVDTIESALSRFADTGYDVDGQYWWAMTSDRKSPIRFIIENV